MIRIVDILKKTDDAKKKAVEIIPNTTTAQRAPEIKSDPVIAQVEKMIERALSGEKKAFEAAQGLGDGDEATAASIKKAVLACRIGLDAGFGKNKLVPLFFSAILPGQGRFDTETINAALQKAGYDIGDVDLEKILKSVEILSIHGQ